MAKRYSLKTQIAEVERELAKRRGVYRSQVASRALTQEQADLQMGIMESVLETLRWLEKNQDQVRALFPPKA
jgi:hypothetical protein